jgi:hypothetical protein
MTEILLTCKNYYRVFIIFKKKKEIDGEINKKLQYVHDKLKEEKSKNKNARDIHYVEYLMLYIYIMVYMLLIPSCSSVSYEFEFYLGNNVTHKDKSKISEMNNEITKLYEMLTEYINSAFYDKYEIVDYWLDDDTEKTEMFKKDIIELNLTKLKEFKIEQSVSQVNQAGGGFLNLYKKKYMKYKEKYLNIKKNFK